MRRISLHNLVRRDTFCLTSLPQHLQLRFGNAGPLMEPYERLRQARQMAGFGTAVEAARHFGWGQSSYIGHENGTRGIRPRVANKYAAAFGVSLGWLLTGEGSPNPTGAREAMVQYGHRVLRDTLAASYQCLADINEVMSLAFAEAVLERAEIQQGLPPSERSSHELVRDLALAAARLFASGQARPPPGIEARPASASSTVDKRHTPLSIPVLASVVGVIYALAVKPDDFPSLWISDSVKEILGYEVEEALAPGWWLKCLHPDDRIAAVKKTSILMRQGRLVQEYRLQAKGGGYLRIKDEASLLRGSDLQPKEIIGFWTDARAA
jgi:PAS domain-containing protein